VRRAVPAVILTLIGLGALGTFKSTAPASSASAHTHTTPTTTPPATAPPPTAAGGNGNDTPQTTAPPTTSAPPPKNDATRTVDGDPFDNRYGTVQVRVTLHGNNITDVQLLQMPNDRARSQFISEQAGPILQQETLQAQSAQIDTVSGATYTSESYAQSLQSALDKAHA
jgi:uncharacterized protein with FMN-binding domain